MQNDGGITASGAFFDSVVDKSDFVNSGYILSVIFQIVATVRLILSGLVDKVIPRGVRLTDKFSGNFWISVILDFGGFSILWTGIQSQKVSHWIHHGLGIHFDRFSAREVHCRSISDQIPRFWNFSWKIALPGSPVFIGFATGSAKFGQVRFSRPDRKVAR